MKNINPTSTNAWKALEIHQTELANVSIQDLFRQEKDRFKNYSLTFDNQILVDFSKNNLTRETLGLLRQLTEECGLAQAKEARLHILGQMQAAVSGPQELSQHAPRLYTMRINPDKIREVIGKGGETIRSITAETHTEINISDDGVVTIAATTAEAGEAAKARIEMITAEVEVGKVYEGTVVKILDNNVGAIVSVMPGKDGLVHISQIAHERVKDVNDYLKVGQVVNVKALDVDERGRVRLSIRALLPQPERNAPAQETEAAGESSAE